MKKRGPDSWEGCFIALMTCLISTLMYGMADLSSFLFVASITRYNTGRNYASFPFVLNSVIQAFTGPFSGYFAKKFGVRIVVLVGSVLAFAGIAGCFFAESIAEVTILWGIVFGVGFGCSTLLLPAIINEYFYKHRSKALGVSYLGSPIGFLIFPPIFEVIYQKYGLSGTFLFLSGINMHCIPLSLLLREPNFKEDNENPPLKNGKEQAKCLNTDSKASHPRCPENENETIVTENVGNSKSYFRRYSLEFLWKQPVHQKSVDTLSEDKGQYIFTLNKEHFSPNSRQNDSIRSYEKINANCYKNLSKEKKGNSILDERQINLDNSIEFRNDKEKDATQSSVNISETCRNLKGKENFELRKLPPPNYSECSTIYFGTNEKEDTFISPKQNATCQRNLHNVNDMKESDDSVLSCNVSPAKSDNINQSTDKTLEVSVIPQENPVSLVTDNNNQEKESSWAVCFKNKSLLGMYFNPIFIVMCISNAIFSLQFTTLATVIIDFAEDHHIDPSNEKFIMMCISIMGLFGMLGFGWVTDGGYMTRHRFGSLCLFIGSVSIATLPQITGLATLITILTIWCISQSSFVLLIPAIIAEYLEKDIQAVAVSAAYVLSGPLYLIIPPLLGHFRDGKGSYDSVFYLVSFLSLLNSILVFFVPCMARARCEDKNMSTETSS